MKIVLLKLMVLSYTLDILVLNVHYEKKFKPNSLDT